MYCVYENWRADNKAVVHKSSCLFCNNGNGVRTNTEDNANGKWHTGYKTEEEVYSIAK